MTTKRRTPISTHTARADCGAIYYGDLESLDPIIYKRHHPPNGYATTWCGPRPRYTYGYRFRDVYIHFGQRTLILKAMNTRLFEIGGELANHLVLLDPLAAIARRHGTFFIKAGHVIYEDHSPDGTWIADGSHCHYAIHPISAYPMRLQLGTVLLTARVNRWGDLHLDLQLPEYITAICRVVPISDKGYIFYGDAKIDDLKYPNASALPDRLLTNFCLPQPDPDWMYHQNDHIFDNASLWDQLIYFFTQRNFRALWRCIRNSASSNPKQDRLWFRTKRPRQQAIHS